MSESARQQRRGALAREASRRGLHFHPNQHRAEDVVWTFGGESVSIRSGDRLMVTYHRETGAYEYSVRRAKQ